MTKPKHISNKLSNILDHPTVINILDRSTNIEGATQWVQDLWDYDLYTRRPGPAYIDGDIFAGTDLDLAAFLYALVDRNAVINLPTYRSMRQTKFKTGQRLVSNSNRHGQILGVSANKNTFIFSVRIKDMNVMKTDEVGDYRNFSLTKFNGEWYSGWNKIEFLPTAKENNFITENRLWSGNTVYFKNFVHPNRWTSFFGEPYFITKLLINRLTEEAKHYSEEVKRILEAGIEFPPSDKEKVYSYTDENVDTGKQIKARAFEVEIDMPENETTFPNYKHSQQNLVKLYKLKNLYSYSIIPKLRFMTRATELAHHRRPDLFPFWIENTKWESGYKLKGKRKVWDRLILFQPEPFQQGVSIRKREYEKSERVTESFLG